MLWGSINVKGDSWALYKLVNHGEFGHTAALAGLAVAKIAKAFLTRGHLENPVCELRAIPPRKRTMQ